MQSHSRDGLLLKKQLVDQEGFSQLYGNIVQLKLPSADGKLRETDVANMTTLLRIVQSIPSKNAEPFKQWLSEVGDERLKEVNDPEIAIQRAM
jgi:DNA-damage-inducible protein D